MADLKLWHAIIHPITAYFRKRRAVLIKSIFPDIEQWKIADVGGSAHFWEKSALDIKPSNISLYNISDSETDSWKVTEKNAYRLVIYDGHSLPVPDSDYDLVVSNSVIEHVPVSQRAEFVAELRRVGKRVYLQTPAKEFLIEPHFLLPLIHWLPKNIGFFFVYLSPWWLLSRPGRETTRSYYYDTNLLSFRDIGELFPDCHIVREKILGITKSYMVYIVNN